MGGMGMMGRSNILVERFKANPEWEQLYEERLVELTSKLYDSGAAAGILAEWVTLLKTQASDLVDSVTVDTEAAPRSPSTSRRNRGHVRAGEPFSGG